MLKSDQSTVRLSFVGDILPSNLPYTVGFGNYNKIENINITHHPNKPDIFFANLESPILYNIYNRPFAGNPQIINLFKTTGINIVSIANNHILEYGKKGFYETLQILKKNNIKVIGINEDISSNIEYFNIGTNNIAFAAFNMIHDIENPSLYAVLTELGIEIALAKMFENKATFKILSFHWGNEYMIMPNEQQIKLAKYAIEKGCDLIIGHHPHVVQKIDKINNRYVFYSLGNAYFDYLFSSNVKKGLRVNAILNNNNLKIQYNYIYTKEFGFNKINENTKLLLFSEKDKQKLNNKNYSQWYIKKTKKVRLINRIKMKLFLIKLFFSLNLNNKWQLIINIKHVFKKSLKKYRNGRKI